MWAETDDLPKSTAAGQPVRYLAEPARRPPVTPDWSARIAAAYGRAAPSYWSTSKTVVRANAICDPMVATTPTLVDDIGGWLTRA